MALGVPPVHVQSAHWLDLDPLDFALHLRLNASTPEEVVACVRRIVSEGSIFVSERREQWQQVVRRMFDPVTEDTYDLFLV